MYRLLSERYGWTPAEIAELTPAQICIYLKPSKAPKFSSFAEAREYARQLKGE